MPELVVTPPAETQAPATESPVVNNITPGQYGKIMSGQAANPAPAPATVAPEAETVAPVVEENFFESDAPLDPSLEATEAPAAQTPAIYESLAAELGLEKLPEEGRDEVILSTIRGIRTAVTSDEYRNHTAQIDRNNQNLSLEDDVLLFIDKSARLGADLTSEQIDELIDNLSPDQFKREVETIRQKLTSDNENRTKELAKLEADAKTAEQTRLANEKAKLAESTRLFKESLSKFEVDGKALSPRLQQAVEQQITSGEFAKALNTPEGLISAALRLDSKLNTMYLAARDKQVATKAVSDYIKSLDGRTLNVGNGSFATPGIRTVSPSDYAKMQKQQ